jgi:OmpA family/PEGA domain
MEMMRAKQLGLVFVLSFLVALIGTLPAAAQSNVQTGKLRITVTPKQSYVFVDGKAIRDGSQTIVLPAGEHEVGVDNYGYLTKTQQVQIVAAQTLAINVTLQKSGEEVSGPFGDIEFKGHPRAAVLLNGTTPAYFVGHVDEFDNNWIWHQWLLVKPGRYQVTVTQKGQTIWSGPVAVQAGKRVVVYLNHNGEMKTKDFKSGLTLGPQPRFDAGVASARVDVAPVTAQLSASQTQTTCGQSAMLNWKTTDAADTSISNLGTVPSSGNQTVSPTHTTSYELVAKGPGGEATRTATIDVNAQPTAMLTLNQPEVTYHKIGDKVVEQGSAILRWSTSNGNIVTLQPLGTVSSIGSQNIEAAPGQTGTGSINRNVIYTLNVANACGGTATRTATLHIVGSIDPAPPVTLASIFYPTNYPERRHPKVGLVLSQEKELASAAATFKNHEEYAQPSELMIVGHADVRGPEKYNLALSQRRADLVKQYLVSQGIAADNIQVRADGKDHQLDEQQVEKLQAQDPQTPPKWMTERRKATWLAYNRRVDIILEPAGQESTEAYPNDAPEARVLWQRPEPTLKAIESAVSPTNTEQAQARNTDR